MQANGRDVPRSHLAYRVARPTSQSAKVGLYIRRHAPFLRQAAPGLVRCRSARSAKVASAPHILRVPTPSAAAAVPCRRDRHRPARCPSSGTNSPHWFLSGNISINRRSQSARLPSRCSNTVRSAASSSASLPPSCISVCRAASRYIGVGSSTGVCRPPLPESTGSESAISPHTESIVRALNLRGRSSSLHPNNASRRNTASANLRVSRAKSEPSLNGSPRAAPSSCATTRSLISLVAFTVNVMASTCSGWSTLSSASSFR